MLYLEAGHVISVIASINNRPGDAFPPVLSMGDDTQSQALDKEFDLWHRRIACLLLIDSYINSSGFNKESFMMKEGSMGCYHCSPS